MIELVKLKIDERKIKAVEKILRKGWLVEGPIASQLEEKCKTLVGSAYGVVLNSGTAALHTALYAIGVRQGDEVITTPFTFVATANSILLIGAKPIFVDIDPATYNINPLGLKKAINKKTKAIIAVSLFGQPADFDSIKSQVKNYRIPIIEDAAQSINASYKGKQSGNLADISCFSFYATKNITSGEGGMITTNNRTYYLRSSLFKNHGQAKGKKYQYVDIGCNYRMSDILASLALDQFKKIKSLTERRRWIAAKYNLAFARVKGLKIPYSPSYIEHSYHQYTLRVTADHKYTRDKFKNYLLRHGIQSAIYYPYPLYHFAHLAKGKTQDYTATEQVVKECLSIPIRPSLTEKEVNYIIDVIANSS